MRALLVLVLAFGAMTLGPLLWSVEAAPPHGTIEVETNAATAHDRELFEAIARELERHEDVWRSPAPRGAKTFA